MRNELNRRMMGIGIGSCAAVAMLAGTAMGQQQGRMHQDHQRMQQSRQMSGTNWQTAHHLPTQSDVVLSGKTGDDRDINVIFNGGRLTSAKVDGSRISNDRVQMKDDQIRIVDENHQRALVTFMLPDHLTGKNSWDQQRNFSQFDDQRFQNQNRRTNQDRYSSQQRYSNQGRMNDNQRDPTGNWNNQGSWETQPMSDHQSSDWSAQQDSWQPARQQQMQDRTSGQRYQQNQFNQRVYGSDFDTQPLVLGITMSELEQNQLNRMQRTTDYDRGVRVDRVESGMPAERAGLRTGDIIVLIDDEPAHINLVQRKVAQSSPGDELNLTVLRDGRERDLNLRVDRQQAHGMHQRNAASEWESTANLPEMPNVQHPGPYNLYRPTEPDTSTANRYDNRNFENRAYGSDRSNEYRFEDRDFRYEDRQYRFDDRQNRYDSRFDNQNRNFRDSRDYDFRDSSMDRNSRTYRTNEFQSVPFDRNWNTNQNLNDRRDMNDRQIRQYREYGPQGNRIEWESGDHRLYNTYNFEDDRFTTSYRPYEPQSRRYDLREGRIYGSDDRVYGTMDSNRDFNRDVQLRSRVNINDRGVPQYPSTQFENLDMPNVEHPGPYNLYRPTRPGAADSYSQWR